MSAPRILIIEDEHALAAALGTTCQRLGADPILTASGAQARQEFAPGKFALVILDIGLPDINGLQLIDEMPGQKVLVITAHGNLENAVAARQRGAASYLVKPLDLRQLTATLQQLLAEPRASALVPAAEDPSALLIGAAPAMQRVFVEVAHACVTESPVLITGPTGTGKSLTARVIHGNSPRRQGPFVTLTCSSLPENLLESELFGHEKNAFTGATTARTGHVERAAGGTLFLDEIGDITPAVQAKLLRLVEEHTFARVGGRDDVTVDLRLITATNRDLRAEVAAGRFREDLFYRLHVLEIEMPALAARVEDLPTLSAFFLGRLAPGRAVQLAPETTSLLARYHWPGNIRELRNALEHAIAVCAGRTILPQHLPRAICRHVHSGNVEADALEQAVENWVAARMRGGATYKEMSAELEARVLRHLLRHFDDKPSVLARVVKLNRATLLKKRKQMGLTT